LPHTSPVSHGDLAAAAREVSRKTNPMQCPVRGVNGTPRRSRVQTRAGASAVKSSATAMDDQRHWVRAARRHARCPERGAARPETVLARLQLPPTAELDDLRNSDGLLRTDGPRVAEIVRGRSVRGSGELSRVRAEARVPRASVAVGKPSAVWTSLTATAGRCARPHSVVPRRRKTWRSSEVPTVASVDAEFVRQPRR
jgi:hypothetical protein